MAAFLPLINRVNAKIFKRYGDGEFLKEVQNFETLEELGPSFYQSKFADDYPILVF